MWCSDKLHLAFDDRVDIAQKLRWQLVDRGVNVISQVGDRITFTDNNQRVTLLVLESTPITTEGE